MLRVCTRRWADFKGPAGRRSSALLLLSAIASLLVACENVVGGWPQSCASGPSPAVLAWDPVSSSNAGYRVYYGTTPGANLQLDAGAATTYTVTNLSSGTTYYFAVTAYDLSAPVNESTFSNVVCKTIS